MRTRLSASRRGRVPRGIDGVAMRHTEGIVEETKTDERKRSGVGLGAVAGALTGLGLGALAGLGDSPRVFPLIGAGDCRGTLGVVLSNAAVGAGVVGLRRGIKSEPGFPKRKPSTISRNSRPGVGHRDQSTPNRVWTKPRRSSGVSAHDMNTQGHGRSDRHRSHPSMEGLTQYRPMDTRARPSNSRGAAERRGSTPSKPARYRVFTKRLHREQDDRSACRTGRSGYRTDPRPWLHLDRGDARKVKELRIPVREEQVDVTKQAVVNEEGEGRQAGLSRTPKK